MYSLTLFMSAMSKQDAPQGKCHKQIPYKDQN